MRIAVALVVLLLPAVAVAQTMAGSGDGSAAGSGSGSATTGTQTIAAPPCAECEAGNRELDKLGVVGQQLRDHGDELVGFFAALGDVPGQLDERHEGVANNWISYHRELEEPLHDVNELDDAQLILVGHALCKTPDPVCARAVAGGVRLIARVADPEWPRQPQRLPYDNPGTCDPYVQHVYSPKAGLGFEYASGWQRSTRPADGRAWSLGLDARARLPGTWGIVMRIDRSTGKDKGEDTNGDGRDDVYTGRVTRWTVMAGPTARLTTAHDHELSRFWQVDGLVGLARAGDRSGPMTGLDVSYQFGPARLGLRTLVGFGDADKEAAILAHAGFAYGGGPSFDYGAGCGQSERTSGTAWAIAMDIPLSGWAEGTGYITPSFGLEGAYHFAKRFDGLVRADLLDMPNGDADRALHSSVLAGVRGDLMTKHGNETRRGMFVTVAAGYDHVATTEMAPVQSGAVGDASLGYGFQGDDGEAYLRLHARFGLTPDNSELFAVFLSFGMELRLDRSKWSDRD